MKKKTKLFVTATAIVALSVTAVVSVKASQPISFYVPSGSMEPTLFVGSFIDVKENAYQSISQVKRGDIVVHSKTEPFLKTSAQFATRVIGLPGDVVKTSGTDVFINGNKIPHVLVSQMGKVSVYKESIGGTTYYVKYGDSPSPAPAFSGTVPKGEFFYLGDNRDNSNDSRYVGSEPFAAITGKKVQ